MRQYQQAFMAMMEGNKKLFDSFTTIHEKYTTDPKKWQDEYNRIGDDVVDCIRNYERRLCATMSKGQYGKFSGGLSEKFWDEIRKVYPKIDFVGVKIS